MAVPSVSTRYRQPPGRSRVTRWATIASSAPPLWASTWRSITASRDPDSRPVRSARPSATDTLARPAAATRAPAAATAAGSASTAWIRPSGPTPADSAGSIAPGPQPTSATLAPGPIPASSHRSASAARACSAIRR
jgi:hypothetical protein